MTQGRVPAWVFPRYLLLHLLSIYGHLKTPRHARHHIAGYEQRSWMQLCVEGRNPPCLHLSVPLLHLCTGPLRDWSVGSRVVDVDPVAGGCRVSANAQSASTDSNTRPQISRVAFQLLSMRLIALRKMLSVPTLDFHSDLPLPSCSQRILRASRDVGLYTLRLAIWKNVEILPSTWAIH